MNTTICSVILDIQSGERYTISWNPYDWLLHVEETGLPYDDTEFSTLDEAIDAVDERWGSGDIAGLYEIEWLYNAERG